MIVVHQQEPASYTWLWILLGVGGVVVAFFVVKARANAAQALKEAQDRVAAARASVAPVVAHMNECVIKLHSSYGGLAKGDATYDAGSKSDASYKAAMATMAQFWAGVEAISARDKDIETKVASNRLSEVEEAYKLATTEVITVSQKNLK